MAALNKNVIEPRINTDETRINNNLSSNRAHTIQVSLVPHVTPFYLCKSVFIRG